MTIGSFTKQARDFARARTNFHLIDGDELVNLIVQHYEQLDSRYKGMIPLKRAYVPEVLEVTAG